HPSLPRLQGAYIDGAVAAGITHQRASFSCSVSWWAGCSMTPFTATPKDCGCERLLPRFTVCEQPQCVEYDEQGRPFMDGHRRADSKAENRGRNEDCHDPQTHDDVLKDDRAGPPTQSDCEWELRQVVRQQRDVRCLHRDVGAGSAHDDAHRGARHGGSIVDAIADHGHLRLGTELLDGLDLVLWHQVAPSLI